MPASSSLRRAASFVAQEISPKNIVERRIDGRKVRVRPLAPVVPYPAEPQAISLQLLEQWTLSEQHKKAYAFFERYPENCLTSAFERSLLYHLIRSMKPQHIIEIGTYFAGSAEVMARALWENGSGLLHTADPMSFHRVGRIIRRWPAKLRSHIKYYPVTSQTCYHQFRKQGLQAHIVFIDGNHDYEYAYFDLLSAARVLKPGGLIIIDDMDQPGPYWAAVEFLRLYPGWREIGNAVSSFSSANPFAVDQGLMGSKFIVLQSTGAIEIGALPYTTGQVFYDGEDIRSVRLSLPAGSPQGTVHAKIYLRSSMKGVIPEQLAGYGRAKVSGQAALTIPLDAPLRSQFAGRFAPQDYNQKVEIILYWQPRAQEQALQLLNPPQAQEA